MERVLINLDEFLGKLYNGVLCLHNAPFSSPLPTRLLSSLVLSVFLSSHLSFVPFFLHSDYNGIWQDIVTSSNLLSREQEQRRWSRERRRRTREKERGIGNKKTKKKPQTDTQRHTIYTNISIRASFLFHLTLFILCPVLTWLARSEIDACVSSWKRTQSWHLIHRLHLSVRRTHRRDIWSFFFPPINFNDMLQCSRNKVRHVQLCKPDNKHQ